MVDRTAYYLGLLGIAFRLQLMIFRHNLTDALAGALSVVVSVTINVILLLAAITAQANALDQQVGSAFALVGLVRIGWGLTETATENLWLVGSYARTGALTTYMVRPAPVLVQLMLEKIHFERLTDVLFGTALLFYGLQLAQLSLTPVTLVWMFFTVGVSVLLYFSIILMGAAWSVWAWNSGGMVMTTAGNVASLSLYPASTYIRIFSTVILGGFPIFVVTAAPSYLLFEDRSIYPSLSALFGGVSGILALFGAAFVLWSRALASYEGTGS